MKKENQEIIEALQTWYLQHHRKLPFRETSDPYSIWVSEIMLQQTKVETVIPYYNNFMKKYPTVFSLAKAQEESLLQLLEGIGYYRRFKHLLKAAKMIVKENLGVFPTTYKEVIALPGIGNYTAGAIMSIAYNKPFSATDGNVIRVFSRVYNLKDNMRLEKNKKKIHLLNQSLIDYAIPKIYTQAIMELGALICLPRNPLCNQCPIQKSCIAFDKQTQDKLPILSKLPEKQIRQYVCLIIYKGSKVFIRRRKEKLLEGMFEYPQYPLDSYEAVKEMLFDKEVNISLVSKGERYTHVFTHQKWMMDVYYVQLNSKPLDDWISVDTNSLDSYPMSKAHRQIRVTF